MKPPLDNIITGTMISDILILGLAYLCLWYATVLWMMLRHESRKTLFGLACILIATAATHTFRLYEIPPGYYEDEIKSIYQAWNRFTGEAPLFSGGDGIGVPMAAYAMIKGVLWQFLPAWWAIRLHSMFCGIILPAGVFGLGRAMRLSTEASFCSAIVASFTPWALLFSRTSIGIEIVWHQVICLWIVAQLAWSTAQRTLGQTVFAVISLVASIGLLMYDYYAGRMVIYMLPMLTLLVPTKRGKALVILGLVIGLATYAPALAYLSESTFRGFRLGEEVARVPWELRLPALKNTLIAFVSPTLGSGGAMAPILVTAMPAAALAAAFGFFLQPWRRMAFLAIVFGWGISPSVVLGVVNSHRMLCAYVAVALSTAAFVDAIPGRAARMAVAVALSAVISWQGITTFFDPSLLDLKSWWTIPFSDCKTWQQSERPVCYLE